MLLEKSAISEKTRGNLVNSLESFFKFDQGDKLDNIIDEVLHDKDLFLYMAVKSVVDSGIILGRMNYFDDIHVEVPYGITYDFKNPSLNIFIFESCHFRQPEQPIKTLSLHKNLPSKKAMGVNTEEQYFNYPSVEYFIKALNSILEKELKYQKGFWVNFNKPFSG